MVSKPVPLATAFHALAALTICVMLGARIVRVHEVAPAVAACRLTEAVLGLRPPATARHNLE